MCDDGLLACLYRCNFKTTQSINQTTNWPNQTKACWISSNYFFFLFLIFKPFYYFSFFVDLFLFSYFYGNVLYLNFFLKQKGIPPYGSSFEWISMCERDRERKPVVSLVFRCPQWLNSIVLFLFYLYFFGMMKIKLLHQILLFTENKRHLKQITHFSWFVRWERFFF